MRTDESPVGSPAFGLRGRRRFAPICDPARPVASQEAPSRRLFGMAAPWVCPHACAGRLSLPPDCTRVGSVGMGASPRRAMASVRIGSAESVSEKGRTIVVGAGFAGRSFERFRVSRVARCAYQESDRNYSDELLVWGEESSGAGPTSPTALDIGRVRMVVKKGAPAGNAGPGCKATAEWQYACSGIGRASRRDRKSR